MRPQHGGILALSAGDNYRGVMSPLKDRKRRLFTDNCWRDLRWCRRQATKYVPCHKGQVTQIIEINKISWLAWPVQ
jgi:hypothetical protein